MKRVALLIGILIPLQVAALEFKNLSLLYTDAPFIPSEAAGISLLTSVNAVEGYPDGTFGPKRTLNRAEFLKIAMASYPKIRVSTSDGDDCFPDVKKTDWFSPYVCLAKRRAMISGYPDGTFQPERSVNYAEALKILGELYDYVAYSAPDEEWYAGYVRAAEFHKTLLPTSLKYDRPLTRGEMARLAAAYRAEYEGQLETYRLSEKSFDLVVRGSSSSSTSTSSASSSSSSSTTVELHAISHFLVLGTVDLIANGFFKPQTDTGVLRNVTAKFRREPKNIAALYLVDANGTRIATLTHDTFDPADLTWKAQGTDVSPALIPTQGTKLGLTALIKEPGAGFSEELLQIKYLSINVSPIGDEFSSYQILPTETSFPSHQTAMGHITAISNNRPTVVDFAEGDTVLLAEFAIEAETVEDAHVAIDDLTFSLTKHHGAVLSDLRLGSFHTTDTVACALKESQYITCPAITESIGRINEGSIIVQLWGTLEQDPQVSSPELQIDIIKPGKISTTIEPGELGDVLWTDGTGQFKWLEQAAPLATGSLWK